MDIVILIEEVEARNGLYTATLDGRILCTSRIPFVDSARVLINEGYDPERRIIMKSPGSNVERLAGFLGKVARLTVIELKAGRALYFARWKPFSPQEERPAMRLKDWDLGC